MHDLFHRLLEESDDEDQIAALNDILQEWVEQRVSADLIGDLYLYLLKKARSVCDDSIILKLRLIMAALRIPLSSEVRNPPFLNRATNLVAGL